MPDALDDLIGTLPKVSTPPAGGRDALDDLLDTLPKSSSPSSFQSQPQQNAAPPVRPGSPSFVGPVQPGGPQLQAEETPAPKPPTPVMDVYRRQPSAPGTAQTYSGPAGKTVTPVKPETSPTLGEFGSDLKKFLLSPPRSVQDAVAELNQFMVGPFQIQQKAIVEPLAGLTSPAGIASVVAGGGVGAMAASNTARMATAGKAANAALSAYFAGESFRQMAKEVPAAWDKYKQGDYWGAAGELGAAGTSGVLGTLAALHAHGQIGDIEAIAGTHRALQERLNTEEAYRKAGEAAEARRQAALRPKLAGGEESPPPPGATEPQPAPQPVPADHIGTAPPPPAEPEPETGSETALSPVVRGSVHTAPDGTVFRVQGIAGNQVIYQQEAQGKKQAGVASMDRFREMAGIPAESDITKPPVRGADVLSSFPQPQPPAAGAPIAAGPVQPPGGGSGIRTPGMPEPAMPPELGGTPWDNRSSNAPPLAGPLPGANPQPAQPPWASMERMRQPTPEPAPYSQFVKVGNRILDAAGQQIATMSDVGGESAVHLEGEHANLSGQDRADLVEEIEKAPEQESEGVSSRPAAPRKDLAEGGGPASTTRTSAPLRWADTQGLDDLKKEFDNDPQAYYKAMVARQKGDKAFIDGETARLQAVAGKKGANEKRREIYGETNARRNRYEYADTEMELALGPRAAEMLRSEVEGRPAPADKPAPTPEEYHAFWHNLRRGDTIQAPQGPIDVTKVDAFNMQPIIPGGPGGQWGAVGRPTREVSGITAKMPNGETRKFDKRELLEHLAGKEPAKPEAFKEGDKVQWTNAKGEKRTGTIDSNWGDGTYQVDEDKIASAGGVPIRGSSRVRATALSQIEAPAPAQVTPDSHDDFTRIEPIAQDAHWTKKFGVDRNIATGDRVSWDNGAKQGEFLGIQHANGLGAVRMDDGTMVYRGPGGLKRKTGAPSSAPLAATKPSEQQNLPASKTPSPSTALPPWPSRDLSPKKKTEAVLNYRRAFFTPGNVVTSYGGSYDKVLKYERNNDTGGWRVQVIHSDPQGNPLPEERPRWHSTEPEKSDRVVATAPIPPLGPSSAAQAPTKPSDSGTPQPTPTSQKPTSNEGAKPEAPQWTPSRIASLAPADVKAMPREGLTDLARAIISHLRNNAVKLPQDVRQSLLSVADMVHGELDKPAPAAKSTVPPVLEKPSEKPILEAEQPGGTATPAAPVRPAETGSGGPARPGPLAEVPAQDVVRPGEAGQAAGVRPGGGGVDEGHSGRPGGAGDGLQQGVGNLPADGVPSGRGGRTRTPRTPEPSTSRDYRITAADQLGQGTERTKAKTNLEAIRTLKKIEAEGREATPEEQAVLVKYVGWGQLAQAFDPWKKEWQGFQEELKDLLGTDEYEKARASTKNAHYTSPEVVAGMWKAMEHLGIKDPDVDVLEPSMGIGHFFGLMPESLLPARRTGVEIDPLTGRIAQLLYPTANVQVTGFERAALANNYFDLAISNVPFGKYGVHDPAYKRTPFVTGSIHNYFFAKALDKVRPGGIVAFITSSFTMDAKDSGMRRYLAGKADLLGAIRLPGGKKGAFAQNAGTEVTTDIIFLQKREPQTEAKGEGWAELAPVTGADEAGKPAAIPVNEYYARHPEMMLGQMALQGTMYGPEKSKVLLGELTPEAMQAAISKLPANVYHEYTAEDSKTFDGNPIHELPNAGEIKDGGYGLKDGTLIVRSGDRYSTANVSAAAAERVKAMMGVRDAVREVFRTQLNDSSEPLVEEARKSLNQAYDRFVKKHGPLNSKENVKAFSGDPDAPLLASLEDYNREDNKAEKRPIFTRRTIERYKPVEHVDRPADALAVSLAESGRIDWMRMQELTGQTPDVMQEELSGQGLLFRNPEGQRWETADGYLSGDVRKKLAIAENTAQTNPEYQPNVEALRAVQPKDLAPRQINARLGASWIPTQDIRDFVAHLLFPDVEGWSRDNYLEEVQVGHAGVLGNWSVRVGNRVKGLASNTTKWGHGDVRADQLIEKALNLQYPTIRVEVPTDDGKSTKLVVDKKATLAAQEKQDKIRDEFKKWLWSDQQRAERLARKYNDEFNNLRLREYNGAHLTLPGMARLGLRNQDLDAHQKNAIWRIVQNGNTLLAHVVGAGKTFEMVAAAMELKRMGLIKKPMFVVPNHMVEQWGSDFLRLYPSANVFVAGKEHFSTGNRQKAMSRIATGNYDAVIVAHRSFQFIPVSDATFNAFMREQLHDINLALVEAEKDAAEQEGQSSGRRRGKGRKSPTIKQLEAAKARIEKQIEDRAKREAQDKTLSFEELGVDHLFVDEAHMFKNLYYPTKMTRVAGLPNSQSDRAMDMYIKSQYMTRLHNGRRGVVFATGTPISNSMAELYTMQRYLQLEHLKETGMQAFDSWAQNFGEPVMGLELAPEGGSFRMNTRFARFVNLPELLTAFRSFADVKSAEELNLPRPALKTGKPIIISVPASQELKAHVASLGERAAAIRSGHVQPDEDNMLAIVGEGRKGALDMRLINPSLPDNPGSKVNIAIEKIHEIWKASKANRSAQTVFLDLGTPRGAATRTRKGGEEEPEVEGDTPIAEDAQATSVYEDIRKKLVRKGVPAKEIRFIHEAKNGDAKQLLFDDVNAGRVRVIIGSTEKMGAGTNMQRRLLAQHHLDVPWRPSDVEQRDGRILRPGNENPEVEIYRYVTEDSFDGYMWQTVLSKAKMIAQAMTGDLSQREIEDTGIMVLSAAEAMGLASGNPEVRERIEVDLQVRKLQSLAEAHADEQRNVRFEIERLPGQISSFRREQAGWQEITSKRDAWPADKEPWAVAGITPKDATERNKALTDLALRMTGEKGNQTIGSYKGFSIVAIGHGVRTFKEGGEEKTFPNPPSVEIGGLDAFRRVEKPDDALPLTSNLRNSIDLSPDRRLTELAAQVAKAEGRLHDLQSEAGKPFEHEAKLEQLQTRLKELNDKLDIGKQDQQLAGEAEESIEQRPELRGPSDSERGSFSFRPKSRISSDQLRKGLNAPYHQEPGIESKLGGPGYWVRNGKVVDLAPGETHGGASLSAKDAELNAGAVRGRGENLQARADSLDSVNFKAGVNRAAEEARKKGVAAISVEANYPNGRTRFATVPLGEIQDLLASPHRYIREQGYGYESRKGSGRMLVDLPDSIAKAGVKAAQGIAAASDELLKLFAPAAREGAQPAAMAVRNRAAELAQRTAIAEKALKDASKFIMSLPEQDRWDWYDRIENNQPEPNPSLETIGKLLRTMLNGRRQDVQNLGTGKLEKFIEHYLPHIYKDPKKAEETFGSYYSKRPFEGSKAFLKRRKYETLRDAMEGGLEPISDNPIEMVKLKLREMDKYIMSHRIMNDVKEQGLLPYVPSEQLPPHGYQYIDDKIATVFGPPSIPVTEHFDRAVTDRLNELAANLGIKHERGVGIGGTRAGYAVPGKVTTRFATPESVLAHEIGHQLEWKYNLSGRLKARDYPERTKELRALADLRYEGQETSEHFKKYVRERDEKIANAIAALLYAPEKFKETAPNTWDMLRDELWHIPELRPLFDIKPSMVLGSRTAEVPVSGIRILGKYAAPEPAARVINNYLSPGLREKSGLFRGYLGVANAMNQFNLGFSAFHLAFTSADAMISKFALGIYQAAHGHPIQGLVSAVQFPAAPFTGIVRGQKLLKEYYKPGTQGAEIGALVDSMIIAGGRAKMDSFYKTEITKNMMHSIRHSGVLARLLGSGFGTAAGAAVGHITGIGAGPGAAIGGALGAAGALRLPFAAAETFAIPILDWIVPRQKLAVFADLAEFELQRAAEQNLSPEELQANLARAWDSVDNRMGQLVYDNLFWHKTFKDLLMGSVRSVGWNVGTIREIVGGAADIRKLAQFNTDSAVPMQEGPPGEFNPAKKRWSPDVSTRLSYLIALPIVAGILGGVLHYLFTGEAPHELKDYYLPRSGPRGTPGWNRRVMTPTYMKDVLAVKGEGLWKVARGKIHVALSTIADMLANEDYYHKPIRNPDDPLVKQAEDYAKHALEQATPMSFKSPSSKRAPKETPGQKVEKFFGVTKAPQYLQDGSKRPHKGQRLPHYGTGGIIEKPTKALVGEAGPEEIVKLGQSGEDIVRGSTNIPLSQEGLNQVKELAERLAVKGGFDRIICSDLKRGVQTAHAISEATGTPITRETSELHPWHLGEIEGQPTKQVLDQMNRYVIKKPDVAVPGRGSASSFDGEAFNTFKRRLLGFIKEEIASLKKDPDSRTALVTHYRDLRTIEAWVRKGAPASLEIDAEHVTKKGNDPPGTIYRLYLASSGKVVLEPVNLKSNAELKGGLYVIRHGSTLWNGENTTRPQTKLVSKPTVMTLAKDGPVAVVPVGKAA